MENAEITVQPQAKSAAYIVKAERVDLVVGSKETPEVAPDITDEKETKPPKREAVVKETEPVDEKAIDGNGNDASSLEAGNGSSVTSTQVDLLTDDGNSLTEEQLEPVIKPFREWAEMREE